MASPKDRLESAARKLHRQAREFNAGIQQPTPPGTSEYQKQMIVERLEEIKGSVREIEAIIK